MTAPEQADSKIVATANMPTRLLAVSLFVVSLFATERVAFALNTRTTLSIVASCRIMETPKSEQRLDYSFIVTASDVGERLDKFLATQLNSVGVVVSRTRIQQWLNQGAVQVDEIPRLPKYRVHEGDQIEVQGMPLAERASFEPEDIAFEVVAEAPDFLVINKPTGLVTHPAPGHWSGTLMNGLLHRRPALRDLPRAGIVHRLDRETSGLMVVAASEASFVAFSEQLASRAMGRRYLAVTRGLIQETGLIDQPIGRHTTLRTKMAVVRDGKPALTRWRRLAGTTVGPTAFSLVECQLSTGRTHQIRVHMQALGFPLVGDPLYGQPYDGFQRQALHAWSLQFEWPIGTVHRFFAPPPEDFCALCSRLGLADPWTAVQARMDEPWPR